MIVLTIMIPMDEKVGTCPKLSYALIVTSCRVPLSPENTPAVVTTPVSRSTRYGTWGVTISNHTMLPFKLSESIACKWLQDEWTRIELDSLQCILT